MPRNLAGPKARARSGLILAFANVCDLYARACARAVGSVIQTFRLLQIRFGWEGTLKTVTSGPAAIRVLYLARHAVIVGG